MNLVLRVQVNQIVDILNHYYLKGLIIRIDSLPNQLDFLRFNFNINKFPNPISHNRIHGTIITCFMNVIDIRGLEILSSSEQDEIIEFFTEYNYFHQSIAKHQLSRFMQVFGKYKAKKRKV